MSSSDEYAPGLRFRAANFSLDNLLIFIGGLGDGLDTVPYILPLSLLLAEHGWSLVQIETRSSYSGWGTGSLARDVEDITIALKYFIDLRKKAGSSYAKIALLGHSTGCQDIMHYLTLDNEFTTVADRPKINGAIIQASVSDREAFLSMEGNTHEFWQDSLAAVSKLLEEDYNGNKDKLVPSHYFSHFFDTPISNYRWHALFAVRGDDDYFSSDLTADDFAKTFGQIASRGRTDKLLVLYSGKDEFVPKTIDKYDLMARFQAATSPTIWSPLSGVIEGATHNFNENSAPGAQKELITRIRDFVIAL
jgi:pimeloyl-ACP methyl ester carboxylesterase